MTEESGNGWRVAQNVAELHRAAMVWDNHGGFAYHRASHLEELSRWATSGVDYLSINAGFDVMPWTLAVEALSRYRHWVRARGDVVVEVDTVEHLVEHIDHMVSLVGPEHVGIGMDSVLEAEESGSGIPHNPEYWPERQYSGGGLPSSSYIPPEAFPQVTEKLLERGYKDWDVRATHPSRCTQDGHGDPHDERGAR